MSAFMRLTHMARETVFIHPEGQDCVPYTEVKTTTKPIILRKALVRAVWEHNRCRTVIVDKEGDTDRYDVAESFEQIAEMLEAT